MKLLSVFLFISLAINWSESSKIEFNNKCGYDIWVSPLTNAQGTPLREGIAKIANGGWFTYQVPSGGW